MAENPKLDMASSYEACELKENTSAQKIRLLDHVNGFQYNAARKSDNFVIDMDTVSNGVNKDVIPNSRTTMQRTFSRKGSLRGGGASMDAAAEKKTNSIANNTDTIPATSSPIGPSTPEKLAAAAVGSTDHLSGPLVHHQITITTGNIITTPGSRAGMKRNSFKRCSTWAIDPKRVLFFFATLSSMGTILLIYFTLSIKYTANANTDD